MLLPASKRGYTVMEVLLVIAILVILGAISVPTISAFRGNTRIKAAADAVRGRMSEARMKAIEDGQSYRLAISADGRRLRVAPDTAEAMDQAAGEVASSGGLIREDDLPEQVIAELLMDEETFVSEDANGWRRIATFLPDGTCKEDVVHLLLQETGVNPLLVRLRGLTGTTSVTTQQAAPTGGR